MTREPNIDDANLILRLYELRREEKLRDGRAWFVANCKCKTLEEWKQLCPPGSQENAYFRMVTTYWEMAASFVASGVVHPELYAQSGLELLLVWERLRHMLAEYRQAMKNPGAYKNMEKAASILIPIVEQNGPEAYQAFAARVGIPA
jgi:hypothetical protein